MEDEALAEVDGGAHRRSGDLLGEDVEVKIGVGVGHAGKLSFAASGALVDADLRSDGRAGGRWGRYGREGENELEVARAFFLRGSNFDFARTPRCASAQGRVGTDKPPGVSATEQIAAAAGVHPATITRWVRRWVLPEPQVGRLTRWPPHAADQARWVKSKLEAGYTFAEIASMLERGEFKGSRCRRGLRRHTETRATGADLGAPPVMEVGGRELGFVLNKGL